MSKIGKNKAMYYLVIYMKYIYKKKRMNNPKYRIM